MKKATKAQLKSYKRLCKRYGVTKAISREFDFHDNVLMCNFGFIWIGIEIDGYTHS
jgi:hypothetical protein